ncbi:glutamate ABC transporter substrate-binding protein [Nocardioides sp.]|jgi:polar amino acid transport system substrate-binding protein|uniref:glutamate ABC transporter substrate-binding protein n=1 Tax=Nocardioides sp. TaxID=35761 RepID=UPI00262C999D|nr:glutamate ABC transporter substrate-binding protein [Nocardioides sp.]
MKRPSPSGRLARRRTWTGPVVALLLVLAACGYDETTVPSPDPATVEAGGDDGPSCTNDGSQVRSYAPEGDVLGGDAVARIRKRGRLVAGVAADTFLLGSRDPSDGQIKGFDIDMATAIADRIFAPATGKLELRVITAAERIPLLEDGTIDIVARNMTVNCDRWQQIAFSAIYYDAGQKVLVGRDSGIEDIAGLADKRICAPGGTTSIQNIQTIQPEAIPVTAGDNSACMVLFQNGEADGVSTDDTVLAGLAAQDPYAVVLDTDFLTAEPYGIGVNADDVDLVQLINVVLEEMRADGRWQDSYDRWLRPSLQVPGKQPRPQYGR